MDCIDLFKRAAMALQTDSRYLAMDQARKMNDKDEELQNLIGEFNLARMDLNNEIGKPERSLLVSGNAHGGIARLDGGFFRQNNRDADNVSCLIACFGGDLLYLTVCQVGSRGVDVHLLPVYTSCPDRYRIARQKTDR